MQPSPTRLHTVAAATLLACGSCTAQAQPAQAPATQRIEITGSAIKRTDAATPAPVETISRAQIERIGATTVNELIKSIAAIDILDTGELAGNSPGGSGTARVRMRGLGDTQTLVLINGRRVPNNPMQDASGAGSAFDINQLPLSAIDRVEVLKDGGSAIYGADAVAGVVNFILRRDFRGTAAKLTLGQSSRRDGDERQIGLTAGFGEPTAGGVNLLAALDVLRRDPILRKDREISRSSDFRRFGPVVGVTNLDGRSSFAPEGNILAANGVPTGQTVAPCPPERINTTCRYDFNASLLTAYNAADRISALLAATWSLSPDWTAFGRLMASQSEDVFEAHPVPDNFVLPDGRRYAGRFMQGGPRTTERTGRFVHAEASVEGSFAQLDFKAGLSRGVGTATNRDSNYFERSAYNLATQGNPATGQPPTVNPTVTSNDPAVIEALRIRPVRKGESTLDLADAQLAGEGWRIVGREPLRWAVGLNLWREDLIDTPDPLAVAGRVVGSIQQSAVAAEREAQALYGELQIPLGKALEIQAAARHDRYDTASRTSPKLALKWQALPALALRGSYAESFKMPTLKQLYANAGQGAINLTESQCVGVGLPAGCAGLPAFRLTGSNPALRPETGKTVNLGFIAEVGAFSASVDVWKVDKTDNITTPTLDDAIAQRAFAFDNATGRYFIFQNLQNFARSQNAGVDVDAQWRQRAFRGDYTLRANGTYYTTGRVQNSPGAPWDEFNGIYGAVPLGRWRASIAASTQQGPWSGQLLLRLWSGLYDSNQPGRLLPEGVRKIPGHQELDFTLAWAGTSGAAKGLKLSATVKNLLDRMPPFSATNATNNNNTQQGFAELYTSRGRYFQIAAELSLR
jgi:iron complex outermembrane receptor protein